MVKQITARAYYDAPSDEAVDSFYNGMRRHWQPVLPAAELARGELKSVELLEEKILLTRLDGKLVALQDLCRHFQARLSNGEIREIENSGQCVSCRYHGWAYDASGQCVEIPQLVEGRDIPQSAQVPTYLVQEKYGLIWVCLEPEPKFDLPDFPEFEDPTFQVGPLRTYEPWAAAAPRVLMGTLDDTHFPWVHEGILGDRSHAQAPDHKVWREDRYLRVEFTTSQPKNAIVEEDGKSGERPFVQDVDYSYHVGMPNVLRLVTIHRPFQAQDEARVYVIWLATCPRKYNETDSFWRLARNFDVDPARDRVYEEFEDAVRAQDRPMVESQRPWLLPPFWTKIELPLRPADLPLLEYQKWLEELGIATAV
ncbi:MAG: (2Fe-2S)-binding protein [Chloroflexota bacterium]|nr:MAG: (2Fe-2S)-binding protein [Chloroflexota bacterium]